jgi:hypothetical protein
MFIALPLQQWLHKHALMLRYTCVVSLVIFELITSITVLWHILIVSFISHSRKPAYAATSRDTCGAQDRDKRYAL